jgi:hypothetical protein
MREIVASSLDPGTPARVAVAVPLPGPLPLTPLPGSVALRPPVVPALGLLDRGTRPLVLRHGGRRVGTG